MSGDVPADGLPNSAAGVRGRGRDATASTAELPERIGSSSAIRDAAIRGLIDEAPADGRRAGTIYDGIRAERKRAHLKHGPKSMESAAWDDMRRLRILIEEVGEIGKVFNELDAGAITQQEAMRQCAEESLQTAAMAAAWSEAASRALAGGLGGDAPAAGAADHAALLRKVREAAQREASCDLQGVFDHGRRGTARLILDILGEADD